MNDFFGQIWLDNPVKDYFIIAAVILFVLLMKKYISRYFAGLLFLVVHKIWKDVDRNSFKNLVAKPLGIFLLILVSIVSIHKLAFPLDSKDPKRSNLENSIASFLNTDLYGYNIKDILHSVATIIIIISFIRLLMMIIHFISLILERRADLTPDQADNQLIVFFRDFFKVILVVIGITLVLKFAFGFNVGTFLTGLSIVGAAIALSLRESLENLIASFIIFFDKPFTTGDLVKVHYITGTVEKIGLRSTRIRTDTKTFVSVPNKQMVDSIVDNLSLRTQRRGDLKLELGPTTPTAKLELLVAGVEKIVDRKEIESASVFLSEIASNAVIILSDYYTAPITIKEFNTIKQEVNLQSLKLLEELQIEIAGASTDVRITKEGA